MFRTRLGLQRLESRDNPSDIIGLGDPTEPAYDPPLDPPTDPLLPGDPIDPIEPVEPGDPLDPGGPYLP
jgi:hypothetical protein